MSSTASFGNANVGFQAQTINGPVHTECHLSPERPETPPPRPSAVIPFPRDADFVERGAILDQVHQRCVVPGSRTALVGLGGVGKSQLAIEYAYRTRERSPETWVFWVYASNAARFEQSYRDIGDCVKLPGRQEPKANVLKLVHDWLHDCKGRWLLVVDNLDDASFLLHAHTTSQGQPAAEPEPAFRPLRDYLPQCSSGSLLITTRNKEAALRLVEQRDMVAVEPMDDAQAQALFEKKLGTQADSSDIAELAAALEYMPLAIAQAAAYISQRAPRCSVRQYLEDFMKSERKRTSLLNRDDGQPRRDGEAKNSIIITWQISFKHIQQIRPTAADLLSLMSFFDRQAIPEALLRSRTVPEDIHSGQKERCDDEWGSDADDDDRESIANDDDSQSSTRDDEFEDDVVALRNFCFISVDIDGTSFEMHAMVQLATRKWLEANGKLERWKQQFIGNLCAEFPTGEYENWATCQALFAHAKSAVEQQPEGANSLAQLQWATLLYRAAWYAWKIGNTANAEELAVKSMKVRRKILGQDHDDTLWSMTMVGNAYTLRGRWKSAEDIEVQVLESRKKKLGADHLDTLTSMANLALTYQNQGRWDAAEELHMQVLETNKKKLGADHLHTLTSMANLASTYWNQGRWDAAEELQTQVLETFKKKLGADHPKTLMSMNNLAFTWKEQGRDAEAIRLMTECVQLRQRMLGVRHPNTVSSSAVLAQWEAEQVDVTSLYRQEEL